MHKIKVWRKLRPTNGGPYSFETEAEAIEARKMCYEPWDEVKIEQEAGT
jgi:hypothetical protein